MSLQSQVNAFILRAGESEKTILDTDTKVQEICDLVQSILFLIGSCGGHPLTEEDLRKLVIPREPEGCISERHLYMMRGLTLIKRITTDYLDASNTLNASSLEDSAPGHTQHAGLYNQPHHRKGHVQRPLPTGLQRDNYTSGKIKVTDQHGGQGKKNHHRGPKGMRGDLLRFFAYT